MTLESPKATWCIGTGLKKRFKRGSPLLPKRNPKNPNNEYHFGSIAYFNVYFPNGKASKERLDYKMDFYEAFLDYIRPMIRENKRLVVCGDFNTAHHEIDLARPKENEKVSGFLPIERAWMDKFVEHGFTDTLRHFNKEAGQYTWWDQKTRARERNVGWRIDYVFVSANLLGSLSRAFILPEVMGSDHCPVGIELDLG